MPTPQHLRQLYLATKITVLVNGAILPATEVAKALGPAVYVLTAWNPGSKELPVGENRAANLRLAESLGDLGCEVVPAICEAADGKWMEESLATADLSLKSARSIGRDFGQEAIFELTSERLIVYGCFTMWQCDRSISNIAPAIGPGMTGHLGETVRDALRIDVSARFARAESSGWQYEGCPGLPCPYCGGPLHVFGNTLRAKGGSLYWAMTIVCRNEGVARLPSEHASQLSALKAWRSFALASRDADDLALTERSHWVYVFELDDAVGPREGDGPWVYVGQSVHSPTEWLQQHREAHKASKWPRVYVLRLRPDLYRNQPVLRTQTDAERYEEFLAERLKVESFSVKG